MTYESEVESEVDLRQKTVAGIGWTFTAQFGRQGTLFLISIVLARLLTPEDFGLLGMIIVFTGFLTLFTEMGFGAALIQREELSDGHYDSVFWLNLGMGVLLTALFIIFSPLIASFYREPDLTPLIRVISINFIFTALGIVQKTILQREMNFRKIAVIEIIAVLVGGALAINMALSGLGVWSLIFQILVASAVASVALWWQSHWRPHFSFDRRAVSDLWGFSSNLLGFSIVNYWTRNADNLLIGRFMGSESLGLYTRAYSTMLMPLSQVTNVLSRVMFPALSRVQHDKIRVKRIYLRSIAMIALVTFPMMLGLFVVAEDFVLAVYGAQWSGITTVLQIFCLVGMLQSIGTTVGWIYQSQGRTDWMFRWGLLVGTLGVLSFIIGVFLGSIEAVALCYAILNFILLYWNITIPGKLIDLKFYEALRSVAGILGCTIVMAGAVWILSLVLPDVWPHWAYLALQSFFGVLVYGALIHLFDIQAYRELRELVIEQWKRRKTVNV
jgi:O-antigen/teichoic acid export membrane protein